MKRTWEVLTPANAEEKGDVNETFPCDDDLRF